jgi:uncharacterized protein (TIGR03118 family)
MSFAHSKLFSMSALATSLALGFLGGSAHAGGFTVTNLVSDGFVPAATIDPSLVNPWGLAYGPASPIWVNDNGAGVATIYTGSGTKIPLAPKIFPGDGSGTPTGQTFNSGGATDFMVSNGKTSGRAIFLMDTEDGTISGWAPSVDPSQTFLGVDNSGGGPLVHAVYKGLTLADNAGVETLYASNFRAGQVEMYSGSFGLLGTFTDPTVMPGYAPFNVQALGGKLYVTFGLQDAIKHDEQDGPGLGYVDVFNLDGTFDHRIASAGGPINAPWGLAIAPASFGKFAGDLLVGNFGDGTISTFNLTTNAFDGLLPLQGGGPVTADGLWGIIPGNGHFGLASTKIYFSAGLNGESDGLFGVITAVPEPSTWATMLLGFGVLGAALRRTRSRASPA